MRLSRQSTPEALLQGGMALWPMLGGERKQCCSAAAAKAPAVLSVCIAPFTLLHALSLVCAAEAELPLLKSRPSLKHRQSDGDRDLMWVSSPQNELQKI